MNSSISQLQKVFASLQTEGSTTEVKSDVIDLMRRAVNSLDRQSEPLMVTQQHPLGFFVCKWSLGSGRNLRLHLWCKEFGWTQEPGWEIHDHVFSFSSLVLLGALKSRTFEIAGQSTSDPRYSVYEVVYKGANSSMNLVRSGVSLEVVTDTVEAMGTLYNMQAGVLHCTELISDRAVTVLAACDATTGPVTPRVVSEHQRGRVSFDRSPADNLDVSNLLLEFADELARK